MANRADLHGSESREFTAPTAGNSFVVADSTHALPGEFEVKVEAGQLLEITLQVENFEAAGFLIAKNSFSRGAQTIDRELGVTRQVYFPEGGIYELRVFLSSSETSTESDTLYRFALEFVDLPIPEPQSLSPGDSLFVSPDQLDQNFFLLPADSIVSANLEEEALQDCMGCEILALTQATPVAIPMAHMETLAASQTVDSLFLIDRRRITSEEQPSIALEVFAAQSMEPEGTFRFQVDLQGGVLYDLGPKFAFIAVLNYLQHPQGPLAAKARLPSSPETALPLILSRLNESSGQSHLFYRPVESGRAEIELINPYDFPLYFLESSPVSLNVQDIGVLDEGSHQVLLEPEERLFLFQVQNDSRLQFSQQIPSTFAFIDLKNFTFLQHSSLFSVIFSEGDFLFHTTSPFSMEQELAFELVPIERPPPREETLHLEAGELLRIDWSPRSHHEVEEFSIFRNEETEPIFFLDSFPDGPDGEVRLAIPIEESGEYHLHLTAALGSSSVPQFFTEHGQPYIIDIEGGELVAPETDAAAALQRGMYLATLSSPFEIRIMGALLSESPVARLVEILPLESPGEVLYLDSKELLSTKTLEPGRYALKFQLSPVLEEVLQFLLPPHRIEPQGLPTTLPDNDPTGVTLTFPVENCPFIEAIEVSTSISHPWIGDLQITLTHPSGDTLLLREVDGNDQENLDAHYPLFDLPAEPLSSLEGRSGEGTWALQISDLVPFHQGQVLEALLLLRCSQESP